MDQSEAEQEARRRWSALCAANPMRRPGPASKAELDALEARLGIKLPPELRDWLGFVSGAGDTYSVNEFLRVTKRGGFPTIEQSLQLYPMWLRRGLIPIADDGCGDLYLLDTVSSPRAVYFWDHETCDQEGMAYVIASGLWHFVLGVLMEQEPQADKLEGEVWPFARDATLAFDPAIAEVRGVPMPWEDAGA